MIIETRATAPFSRTDSSSGARTPARPSSSIPATRSTICSTVVTRHKLHAKHILLTHAHLDHVTGVAAAKRALGVPVWLHRDDNFLYEGVVQQGLMFGLRVEPQPKVDHFYAAGQRIEFGKYEIDGAPHARAIAPAASAWRSTATGGPRDHGPTDPVRRRHVVRRLNRPNRSARRRHGHAAALDPRSAVHVSRRHRGVFRATAR